MTHSASRLRILVVLRFAFALALIALALGPAFLRDNDLGLLTEFYSMLVLAIMWNLVAGYADIATVGQHAFVGVGAYAFYGFAAIADLDPFLAIPLAGLVALVIAVPAMFIVFRLRTAYLSIGTWVIAEVLMLTAGKIEIFGGGSGTSLPVEIMRAFGTTRTTRLSMIYWLAFALFVVSLAVTYLLLRSRIGLGLTAMRDNEESAGSVGVDVVSSRVVCFLGTAPFLGATGAMIALQKLRISPSASFSISDWTVLVIFNVVIGGIGSIEGPIIGTIVFFVLREYLSDLGAWSSSYSASCRSRSFWSSHAEYGELSVDSCQTTSSQPATNLRADCERQSPRVRSDEEFDQRVRRRRQRRADDPLESRLSAHRIEFRRGVGVATRGRKQHDEREHRRPRRRNPIRVRHKVDSERSAAGSEGSPHFLQQSRASLGVEMVEKIGEQYQIVSVPPVDVEGAPGDFLETVGDAELFRVRTRDLENAGPIQRSYLCARHGERDRYAKHSVTRGDIQHFFRLRRPSGHEGCDSASPRGYQGGHRAGELDPNGIVGSDVA